MTGLLIPPHLNTISITTINFPQEVVTVALQQPSQRGRLADSTSPKQNKKHHRERFYRSSQVTLQQPSRCFKGMPGFRTPVVSGKQFDMNKRVKCQSKEIETKFISIP